MKILFISNSFWNIQNFRGGLVSELLNAGNEVYIAAPKDDHSNNLTLLGATCIELPLSRRGLSILNEIFLYIRIRIIFFKINPDFTLTFTIKPNIYASLFNFSYKVIPNISGLGSSFLGSRIVSSFVKILYKLSLSFSEKVLFQNQDDLDYFLSQKLVNKNKAIVIPGSGVNLEKFSSELIAENPFKDSYFIEQTIILYAGRLIKDKGIQDFIDAAKLIKSEGLKHIQFVCLGDLDAGNPSALSKEELESCINQELIIHLPFSDDVRKFLKFSDCVVLPSYREGLSKILLEAMAMSKPIIATSVPGCQELIFEGENGFLVLPKNPANLAKKIKLFCNLTADQKISFGQRSRSIVEEKYDEQFVILKYQELLGLR
jgi:glycosyltransferase involved in cell wall biosynthesis